MFDWFHLHDMNLKGSAQAQREFVLMGDIDICAVCEALASRCGRNPLKTKHTNKHLVRQCAQQEQRMKKKKKTKK